MPTSRSSKSRRETLNLRIPATDKCLLDRAAEASGKTRTDFILEAVRRAAEEALLDRALIVADPKAYAEFTRRLDASAGSNELLQRTMRAKAPWQAG